MILGFLVGVVDLDLAEGLRSPWDVVVQFQVQEGVEEPQRVSLRRICLHNKTALAGRPWATLKYFIQTRWLKRYKENYEEFFRVPQLAGGHLFLPLCLKLQVEKVFGASHPDPMEIEKAKKVLKVRTNNLYAFICIAFLLLGLWWVL